MITGDIQYVADDLVYVFEHPSGFACGTALQLAAI